MDERELQLHMELLVEQILSSHRSVSEPAQPLANSNLTDQERFLESVKTIPNSSVELAYNFCHYAPPSLKLIDEDD